MEYILGPDETVIDELKSIRILLERLLDQQEKISNRACGYYDNFLVPIDSSMDKLVEHFTEGENND